METREKKKPIRSYKKRTKRFTGQFQLRGVDLEKPSSDHDGTRQSPLFFFLTSKERTGLQETEEIEKNGDREVRYLFYDE